MYNKTNIENLRFNYFGVVYCIAPSSSTHVIVYNTDSPMGNGNGREHLRQDVVNNLNNDIWKAIEQNYEIY